MTRPNPGLDCITGRHLFADVFDGTSCAAGWCLWCGTGTYDAERITDDGRAIGFVPTYRVRVPEGFHRVQEPQPCAGPLVWFDAAPSAILECSACGYVIVAGSFHDRAHAETPLIREGLST